MLGKLVNKFKRQTINDGGMSPPKTIASAPALFEEPQRQLRKSARLNPGLVMNEKPSPKISSTKKFPAERVLFHDGSGCGDSADDDDDDEDDDELEQLEKMSNASLGIGSVSSQQNLCGQSPPVLTSSPPFISEIETNSWDSAGCESGIVLRESAERDDSSRNLELLDDPDGDSTDGDASTPVEKRDSFPVDFSALHAELSRKKKPEGGAFQPVIGSNGCSPTPIGEKRRWGARGISGETSSVSPVPPSPIASRTRGALAAQAEDDMPRAVLTARRTRVRVLYHDPTPRRTTALDVPKPPSPEVVHNVLSESPPNNPSLKRGRHSKGGERPSLNFDKMREQMMLSAPQPDAENMPFRTGSASSPDFGIQFGTN